MEKRVEIRKLLVLLALLVIWVSFNMLSFGSDMILDFMSPRNSCGI